MVYRLCLLMTIHCIDGILEEDKEIRSFKEWTQLYQKNYESVAIRNYKEQVFLSNVAHIQELNAQYQHR